jgi:hypothetical protein
VTRNGGRLGPAGPGAVTGPLGVQSAGIAEPTVGQAVPGAIEGNAEKPPGVAVRPVTV